MKTLNVFHRGKLVGSILDKASTGISFQYSDDADFRLSVSLPLSNKIYTAKEIEPFFSGLLPDGELREQKMPMFLLVVGSNTFLTMVEK